MLAHREAGLALGVGPRDGALVPGLRRADRVDHQHVREPLRDRLLDRGGEDRATRADHEERRQVDVGELGEVEGLDERAGPSRRRRGSWSSPSRARSCARRSTGSSLRADESTSLLPWSSSIVATHCAAPCMSGASGKPTVPPAAFASSSTSSTRLVRRAAHAHERADRRVEVVGLAPHDALGHPGGPTRVEDVEVVGRAGGEVAHRATPPRARPRTRPRRSSTGPRRCRRRSRRTPAASGSRRGPPRSAGRTRARGRARRGRRCRRGTGARPRRSGS